MLVYLIEPTRGVMADFASGSGGMFVQTGNLVNQVFYALCFFFVPLACITARKNAVGVRS